MKNQYIFTLSDKRAVLDTVGGKGASLARLADAGLPVPDGFHVTTAAYLDFVDQNNLNSGIQAALSSVDISQPQTLDVASQAIGELFMASPIPSEIANAIVHGYASLPGSNPAVAVRSSATAEDLPEASFAGQQETYLNVSKPEAVLEATRKCWASLWTARAIGYRARQNISEDGVALAVVVQLLIPSEAAGILFTAHPINGQREQMMVSASWGLGEAVVGGLVTPDTLTLVKSSRKVIHRDTAQKLIQTVRVNDGTEDVTVPRVFKIFRCSVMTRLLSSVSWDYKLKNYMKCPWISNGHWQMANSPLYRPVQSQPYRNQNCPYRLNGRCQIPKAAICASVFASCCPTRSRRFMTPWGWQPSTGELVCYARKCSTSPMIC